MDAIGGHRYKKSSWTMGKMRGGGDEKRGVRGE